MSGRRGSGKERGTKRRGGRREEGREGRRGDIPPSGADDCPTAQSTCWCHFLLLCNKKWCHHTLAPIYNNSNCGIMEPGRLVNMHQSNWSICFLLLGSYELVVHTVIPGMMSQFEHRAQQGLPSRLEEDYPPPIGLWYTEFGPTSTCNFE